MVDVEDVGLLRRRDRRQVYDAGRPVWHDDADLREPPVLGEPTPQYGREEGGVDVTAGQDATDLFAGDVCDLAVQVGGYAHASRAFDDRLLRLEQH